MIPGIRRRIWTRRAIRTLLSRYLIYRERVPKATKRSLNCGPNRILGRFRTPKTLAEYDQWVPGTGKAIVDNWLKESKTRRETYQWTAVRIPIIGQVMGFVVVAGALAISGYAIHLGQSLTGFGVVFAALASVAGAWIAGRRS